MALPSDLNPLSYDKNNKVGTIESVLSGVASGLIGIPKGFFSLGATLIDLGAGTRYAAEVEQFFDDIKAYYSSKGSRCDIWAPGTCILSSVHTGAQTDARGSGYALDRYSGTSMATPQVTGMAARIKSRYPHYTHYDVKQYLIETCQRGTVGDDPAGLPEHTRNLFYADNFFLRHKPIRARTQISWPKSTVNYRKYGARQSYSLAQTSVTGRPTRNLGSYHRGVKYPRTINRKLHLGP